MPIRKRSKENSPSSKKQTLNSLKRLQTRMQKLSRQRELAEELILSEEGNAERLDKELIALNELKELVQRISADCQQHVHKQICEVVSVCLATVFANPYSFRIDFVLRRNKTEAVPVFVRDGLEVDPRDAAGGGVVDVTCFALRVAAVVSAMPPVRRVLILDEPFKHVAVALRPKIAQMLETLSRKMKVQIILTTHFPEVEVGKVVHL